MFNMINDRWGTPLKIRMEMTRINFWRGKRLMHFSQFLRKDNVLYGFLASAVFVLQV